MSKQYDHMAGSLMDVINHPDTMVPAVPNIWGGTETPPAIQGATFPKATPDLNRKKQLKQPDNSDYAQGDE